MDDAPNLLKIPKSECPDIWIRLPRHEMAKIMVQCGRPSRSSWAKSVWSSFGRTVMGTAIWENPIETRLDEVFQLGMLIRTREKGLFLSVYVDDIKLAGKKQNINPMWKVQNKEVDLGEPTSFLDHVYLGCTQRQCEISTDIVDNYRKMFESRISAGATQLHALAIITSKKKKWIPWENCQKYALKLFWNACTWHVLEDPKFYGQWTNLHDRSQNGPKPVTNDYLVWPPIFSSASCPGTMSKRMQQNTGKERIVAKSKPTLNQVSRSAASAPAAPSSSSSSRPGILKAPSQEGSNLIAQCAGKQAAGGSNQNDAASSSQVW